MTWNRNNSEFAAADTTVTPRSITTSNIGSSSTSSTSTTTRHTEPGVSCFAGKNALDQEHDLKVFAKAYNDILGPMNMQIAYYVTQLCHQGMELEVILDALQQTAWARRPSPQYFRAICARRQSQGILTMAALAAEQDAWEARAKPWWQVDDNRDDLPW